MTGARRGERETEIYRYYGRTRRSYVSAFSVVNDETIVASDADKLWSSSLYLFRSMVNHVGAVQLLSAKKDSALST